MAKSRIKQLLTDDLGIPISGCREFGRILGISSADTYGKIWAGENSGISFAILDKIVKASGIDPDTCPLSALFDFGTGYRAVASEVLRKDSRGREMMEKAETARAAAAGDSKKRKRRSKGNAV